MVFQPGEPLAMHHSSDPIYPPLAEALRERRRVIADRESYQRDAQTHLGQLQAVSGRIVELQGQLAQPVDPMLGHYLERCSYDKALAWLEAADRDGLKHQM